MTTDFLTASIPATASFALAAASGLRLFTHRRAFTTYPTPLVQPRLTPQHEQDIAGLLARTMAFRRGQLQAS